MFKHTCVGGGTKTSKRALHAAHAVGSGVQSNGGGGDSFGNSRHGIYWGDVTKVDGDKSLDQWGRWPSPCNHGALFFNQSWCVVSVEISRGLDNATRQMAGFFTRPNDHVTPPKL